MQMSTLGTLILVAAVTGRVGCMRQTEMSQASLAAQASASKHSPFTDGYKDECPAGLDASGKLRRVPRSASRSGGEAASGLFTLVTYNVEWAYAPDGRRVDWLREKVAPAQRDGLEGYDGVLECPKDWSSPTCELDTPNSAGRTPCSSCGKMWDHLNKLSDELASMPETPDVVILPEVDGCTAVGHLREGLKDQDPDYEPYLLYGPNDRTNSQTGFISRIPPRTPLWMNTSTEQTPATDNIHCQGSMGAHGSDKHFVAELDVEGLEIFVIGVHLKSMRQDNEGEACSVREAEALVLDSTLNYIYEKHPNAEVIVAGDFNDFDPETPDRRGAISAKTGGKFPLREFEDCWKGTCKTKKDDGELGQRSQVFDIVKGKVHKRPRLVNLLERVPREARYTHDGPRWSAFPSTCGLGFGNKLPPGLSPIDCPGDKLIDHVLVTPGLAKGAVKVEIMNDYTEVYKGNKPFQSGWAWIDSKKGGQGGWKSKRMPRPKHESDHWPVLVQFDLDAVKRHKFG
eukprot:TRINITY_DN1614_c0_g1_i1.p1 TRINITY_DN1614_c0_g1~~TRINITY_DN1614_c0_g1_i1.p1  ORF type:complete len:537 (-),score=52.20 TRINITY_DN1614_c0_g1_i1:118-1656(-)